MRGPKFVHRLLIHGCGGRRFGKDKTNNGAVVERVTHSEEYAFPTRIVSYTAAGD